MKQKQIPLLDVRDLSVSFPGSRQGLPQTTTRPISNLCVRVEQGELLAVVGASGSGKSLLAHAVLGLLPAAARVSGSIRYRGQELDEALLTGLRGREIALVPQSVAYLDPLMKVGPQVQGTMKGPEAVRRRGEAMRRHGLCERSERLYPFQYSGGMARRALIATAETGDANLILADEPTPGLDLPLARRALQYLREFADRGKGVLLITHDIDLAVQVADKLAVFYAGTTVESMPARDFLRGEDQLRHPYTKALFRALPQNGFHPIPGTQPDPSALPEGCLFAARCPGRTGECAGKIPMRPLRGGMVRCIHAT